MKQLVYAVVLASVLISRAHAMEELPVQKDDAHDDDVAQPSGLFCGCCNNKSVSATTKGAAVVRNLSPEQKRTEISVNERKAQATAALFYTVVNNQPHLILSHLNNGADVNAKDGIGWAPLHYAARDRNTGIARVLLGVPGIDINSTNGNGQTALQIITSRRDCATQEQKARCDTFIGYLSMVQTNSFPFRVSGNRLLEKGTYKSVLSADDKK